MKKFHLIKILQKTSGNGAERLLSEIVTPKPSREDARVFLALHISFFLNLENSEYIDALDRSEVYIDGVAVALAAWRFGVKNLELIPTTDLAPLILKKLENEKQSPKIGLIGGSQDLVEKTKTIIESNYRVRIVYALNGFPETWSSDEKIKLTSEVDVIFVGMGVPNEAIFVTRNLQNFNTKSIVTCGGLFKFLCGQDSRAPSLLRKVKLEWLWRLLREPRRLTKRYVLGALSLIKVLVFK